MADSLKLNNQAGIGNPNAGLIVYIGNRPPLQAFEELDFVRPLQHAEIKLIGELTGNHWRKIFNCFAKLAFELQHENFSSWQALRDDSLLQQSSDYLLSFSPPPNIGKAQVQKSPITIICGKTYFNQLNTQFSVDWLDDYFAINQKQKLIVTPYFDYRQLSNMRITQLVELINRMADKKSLLNI